jgi:excinuclease ABC subunit A
VKVIAAGNYNEIISNPKSLTGNYLKGELTIEAPKKVRKWTSSITIEGARQHNLKDITVEFPLNVLCVVSGVSGSGKTTLIKHILYPALKKLQGEPTDKVGFHKGNDRQYGCLYTGRRWWTRTPSGKVLAATR